MQVEKQTRLIQKKNLLLLCCLIETKQSIWLCQQNPSCLVWAYYRDQLLPCWKRFVCVKYNCNSLCFVFCDSNYLFEESVKLEFGLVAWIVFQLGKSCLCIVELFWSHVEKWNVKIPKIELNKINWNRPISIIQIQQYTCYCVLAEYWYWSVLAVVCSRPWYCSTNLKAFCSFFFTFLEKFFLSFPIMLYLYGETYRIKFCIYFSFQIVMVCV